MPRRPRVLALLLTSTLPVVMGAMRGWAPGPLPSSLEARPSQASWLPAWGLWGLYQYVRMGTLPSPMAAHGR